MDAGDTRVRARWDRLRPGWQLGNGKPISRVVSHIMTSWGSRVAARVTGATVAVYLPCTTLNRNSNGIRPHYTVHIVLLDSVLMGMVLVDLLPVLLSTE